MRSVFFWNFKQRRMVVCDRLSVPYSKVNCLILKDGTDRSSRNVGNYHYTMRKIPQERRSHPFQYIPICIFVPSGPFALDFSNPNSVPISFHRLIEIGRCYEMKMNVEKTKVMRISSNHPQYKL
jgi:hypothetical protein